jgi:hypothetical protein
MSMVSLRPGGGIWRPGPLEPLRPAPHNQLSCVLLDRLELVSALLRRKLKVTQCLRDVEGDESHVNMQAVEILLPHLPLGVSLQPTCVICER